MTSGNLYEFPILASGAVFQGSKSNKLPAKADPELDRILFAQHGFDAPQGSGPSHNAPLYCGMMTHHGAQAATGQNNGFVDCI